MKGKNKKVIAVAFVVVIIMIALMGMASAVTIIDHGMYEHFGFMSGPSNIKTYFKTSDSNAVSWVKLEDEDIRSCEEFQQSAGWAWILPNGDYYSSHFTSMSMCEVRGGVVQGGTCVAIMSIPEDIPGNWQVDFYYKGEKQFSEYFTIYSSIIQSKIDAANPGDTIIIEDGIYNDDYIRVNKRLTIRSENGSSNCIVQAINPNAPVFEVTADYVNISGFMVKGADTGTRLFHADYCNISNNNFLYNDVGIYLSESNSSSISNNTCSNNNGDGICLSYSSNNTISGNNVSNNNHSIALYSSSNNKIYLNNFIKNNNNISSYNSTNIWNSTEKITYTYNETTCTNYLGNYWDDYEGNDANGDGIGDTSYTIDRDKDDCYPLMERFENYLSKSSSHEENAYSHLYEVMDKYNEFFGVYTDGDAAGNHYIPSGWMGDWDNITFNGSYTTDPRSGANCIKVTYSADFYANNHYIPSGWMGDWNDITFNDSYTTDSYSGANCIKINYAADYYLNNHYIPSGWMGDGNYGTTYVKFNDSYTTNPHSGSTCIKITYTIGPEGWTGIYWQDPEKNWGDKDGGYNLTGAAKLTFWAKGDRGGEKGEFKIGGITGPKGDSIQPAVSSGVITLTNTWQKYTIDLTGRDLSHVIGGFCWVTNEYSNPSGCTFYIDDIKYEYEDRNFNVYTDAQQNWAGIYWQDPENNWGDKDRGYNLTGAAKLTFWAKGDKGGEKGEFKVGGITGPKGDSIQPAISTGIITLTNTWQKYTIDLTGNNLSHIIGGFCWVTNTTLNPNGCTFYLDNLKYEYGDKSFNVYTDAQQNWAGIYWQDPENNWGNCSAGGYNLTGATNLSFWAKGANGTEKIEFKIGGIGWDPKTDQQIALYPDSLHPAVSTGIINLTTEWKQYTVDLTGNNLSRVIGGFCWVTNTTLNPNGCTFYLDDIRYNKQHLDDLRFLVSYETTSALEDKYMKNVAFTYDNALVMLAFMARGSEEDWRRAKILGDSLVYCQNHDRYFSDGRLRNAYQAGDIADYQGKARLPGWWNDSEQKWFEDKGVRLAPVLAT